MKNIYLVLVLCGTMALFPVLQSQAAPEAKTMDNAQLVNLLSNMAGLEMPEGTENLSDTEIFEVQVNMLAERGITLFVGAKAGDTVTYGSIATLIYDALVGANDAATEAKINYLAGAGYLPSGEAGDVMAYGEIIAALNIPELTEAVAEAYSSPFGGRGRTGVLAAPANPAPETPLFEGAASQIT